MKTTALKVRLIAPTGNRLGLLSYDTLRWHAWDAAQSSNCCTVLELNPYNAARAAAIELGVPQWRVRVRPALPERAIIHDAPIQSLGVA